jgi:lysophospholipase L1-like esterase
VGRLFNKARAANLALLLFSVLLGLAILEGLARLLPQELFAYNTAYMGDPLLGIPLSNVDVKADFSEEPKPADVYRIVVLGDSQTVSVRNEASYAEVLQALLNREDLKGKRVEVYNAGGPGHSHYQYYLTLKERLIRYQPDLVIVGFYVGNDFLDLYRNDDRPSLFFDGRQFVHKAPEFSQYIDPSRSGWLQSSRVARLVQLFLQRTAGYQLSRVRAMWAIGQQSREGYGAAARYLYTITRGYFINQHIFRQSMNQILFLKSFPSEQVVLDRVNRRVTELMKELMERDRIRLLYVPIPTKLQIEPGSDPVVLDKTLRLCGFDRNALSVEDHLNESFVSLLKEHGIESLDVKGALREKAKTGVLYDETYHLKEAAHSVIGMELYEKVKPIVLSGIQN